MIISGMNFAAGTLNRAKIKNQARAWRVSIRSLRSRVRSTAASTGIREDIQATRRVPLIAHQSTQKGVARVRATQV